MSIKELLMIKESSPELKGLSILEMQNPKLGKEANDFFKDFINSLLEDKSLEEKDIASQIIFNQHFFPFTKREEWLNYWQSQSEWPELSLVEMKNKGGDAATFANLLFDSFFPENKEIYEKLIFSGKKGKKVISTKKIEKGNAWKDFDSLTEWAKEKDKLDKGKRLNTTLFRQLGTFENKFYLSLLDWLKENYPDKDVRNKSREEVFPISIKSKESKKGKYPWSSFKTLEEWKNYRQENLGGLKVLKTREFFEIDPDARAFYFSFMTWTRNNFSRDKKKLKKIRDAVIPKISS